MHFRNFSFRTSCILNVFWYFWMVSFSPSPVPPASPPDSKSGEPAVVVAVGDTDEFRGVGTRKDFVFGSQHDLAHDSSFGSTETGNSCNSILG